MNKKYKLHNSRKFKNTRRFLRKTETDAESFFWEIVRNKKLGYKFRRQHSIGSFIVDFYCPELKLVVELDGESHESDSRHVQDTQRELYLKNLGLIIRRYTNEQVYKSAESVYNDLKTYCDSISKPKPSPYPLP